MTHTSTSPRRARFNQGELLDLNTLATLEGKSAAALIREIVVAAVKRRLARRGIAKNAAQQAAAEVTG